MRLRELTTIRVRYGYRRLHILLQREGWRVNHKLVYRLYCKEGLQMRIKTPRRNKSCAVRDELSPDRSLMKRGVRTSCPISCILVGDFDC